MHSEGKTKVRSLGAIMPQSIEQQLNENAIKTLKLLLKKSLLPIKSNENVGKQRQKTQNILAWQKLKDQSRVLILQNNLHIAKA